MNTKNNPKKIKTASFIALSAMLTAVAVNCYGDDEKTSKPETTVTKEVSVSVNSVDKNGNPLSEEETKKILEALGGDEKLLNSVNDALKQALEKSKSGGTSSVSVFSSAYIVGPDGKLQEIDQKKDGAAVKISDDTKLNSIVKSISMTLSDGKNGSTIDMESLKDLNISELIASAVGGSVGGGFSNKEIQAELASLKKELAEQRKLLNKIYKKLEDE